MRILITGASGLLGGNLAFDWVRRYKIFGICFEHDVKISDAEIFNCNLLDEKAIKSLIEKIRPEVVMHCAAYTNVEASEVEREKARLLNVSTPEKLAALSSEYGFFLIHVSTDGLYGDGLNLYSEKSEIVPKNFYAQTKYEGEKAILALKPESLIIRSSFFGYNIQRKESLAEWILNSLSANKSIQCLTDVYFSPLLVTDLGACIIRLMEAKASGVFNVGSSDCISKYDFAVLLARRFGFSEHLIQAVTTASMSWKAPRPKHPCLDTGKYEKETSHSTPSVTDGVDRLYDQMKSGYREQLKSAQEPFHLIPNKSS